MPEIHSLKIKYDQIAVHDEVVFSSLAGEFCVGRIDSFYMKENKFYAKINCLRGLKYNGEIIDEPFGLVVGVNVENIFCTAQRMVTICGGSS